MCSRRRCQVGATPPKLFLDEASVEEQRHELSDELDLIDDEPATEPETKNVEFVGRCWRHVGFAISHQKRVFLLNPCVLRLFLLKLHG